MGASQASSIQENGGIKVISSDNSQSLPTTSGVRISGNFISGIDEKIQQAYNTGKEEGKASFQSSLEAVAAQVYENIHSQLSVIQTESLEKSKKKSSELKEKLSSSCSSKSFCQKEEYALVACLKENSKTPLQCEDSANAFSVCALSSI